MIRVNVQIDADVLDAIADAALRSPKLMQVAFNRQTTRLRRRILDELTTEPPKPTYPLRWRSERQRRFVMAKLREEGNLPYQRTGALLDGYAVRFVAEGNGGALQITNDTPYAEYVVGDSAQPFHLDNGWVQVADVVAQYEPIVEEALIQTWWTVVSPDGGIVP